jgi:hypothetical protein
MNGIDIVPVAISAAHILLEMRAVPPVRSDAGRFFDAGGPVPANPKNR